MTGSPLLLLITSGVTPDPAPDPLATAMRCRAYAPVMSAIASSERTRIFEAYWTARTEELGKAQGLSAAAVGMKTLIIPIKPDDARETLAACLDMVEAESTKQ